MPQVIFKGVETEHLLNMSQNLLNDLSKVTDTPKDYFILESVSSTFVFDGVVSETYPLIEVKWFDRGQSVKDAVATCITNAVLKCGYQEVEVFFTSLEPKEYYENGKSLG